VFRNPQIKVSLKLVGLNWNEEGQRLTKRGCGVV